MGVSESWEKGTKKGSVPANTAEAGKRRAPRSWTGRGAISGGPVTVLEVEISDTLGRQGFGLLGSAALRTRHQALASLAHPAFSICLCPSSPLKMNLWHSFRFKEKLQR